MHVRSMHLLHIITSVRNLARSQLSDYGKILTQIGQIYETKKQQKKYENFYDIFLSLIRKNCCN